jgi:hypothetical protein
VVVERVVDGCLHYPVNIKTVAAPSVLLLLNERKDGIVIEDRREWCGCGKSWILGREN